MFYMSERGVTAPDRHPQVDNSTEETDMAEMPTPEERFQAAAEMIVTAYALVADYLERLPLPIGIPEMDGTWDARTALPAVQRVRADLLPAQPIGRMEASLYERMLIDWLTAYELGALVRLGGPAPWRLDGIETAVARILTATDLLDDIPDDEDPSRD